MNINKEDIDVKSISSIFKDGLTIKNSEQLKIASVFSLYITIIIIIIIIITRLNYKKLLKR